MTTGTMPAELLAQASGKAVEMFSLWADANQKVLRGLVDLSAAAAQEWVRLYAELASSALEALKEGQAFAARRQADMQESPGDAVGLCRKGLLDSVDGVQRACRMVEGNTQALARSSARLQASAERSAEEIRAAVSQLAGRVQALCTAP
jgi:hypothetical protein